ncbi:cellulose synthase-like protein G3 isoform X2 [Rhododendron vialii]|uniref:cellulose synthase-like protein G3 isoform X2 n=1 Tax=Rhododendron vialii TaxID=182163 RepID=UPI00265FDEDE|nr:cellulose synthase-like protein G3 isoform X2 [Rhododendron vialii]
MEATAAAATAKPLLHTLTFSRATVTNRVFATVYTCAVLALLYHHALTALNSTTFLSFSLSLTFLFADFVFGFMWSTTQSFRMRPAHRRVFPENLRKLTREEDFPAMDVFICTADPHKEPPVSVVNTALSVMAYDYPAEKLSVYVSDDGGSDLTLFAFVEAAKFGSHWLPFCRRNKVVERCPEAYFGSNYPQSNESKQMKVMYESMKGRVENVVNSGKVTDDYISNEQERQAFNKWTRGFTRHDHPTVIQLRVSAVMTNAPIILTLDCDMYSNDPQTPHRVLCYFSDATIRSKVGYIQFPQRFHGLNKNDIYASEFKGLFLINPMGMDGLAGPNYVGTGCFFSRRVFFGGPSSFVSPEVPELRPDHVVKEPIQAQSILAMAHHVADCKYEDQSNWGSKVGFRYGSLVEDYYTGYRLQCEGWRSVFCHPNRPAFLGDVPINLNDVLNQNKRWSVGLLEVAFSKYSPVTFGVRAMGPIMGHCYAHSAFWPIWSIPLTIYAFLPQLALLNGVSIFPKVSDTWFFLYAFLFLGAYAQDCLDFILCEGTFRRWWSDQRMWMLRGVTSYLFGLIEFLTKCLGIATHGFNLTSKVLDGEQSKRYDQGTFEFGVESPMFVPLSTAAIVNLIAFFGGLVRVFRGGDFDGLFVQIFLAGFVVVNCWPIYEAMVLRTDKGRMPTKTTLISTFLAWALYTAASHTPHI